MSIEISSDLIPPMTHEGVEGIEEYQQELTADVNTNNSDLDINNTIDRSSAPSIDVDITDTKDDDVVDNDVEALLTSQLEHDDGSNNDLHDNNGTIDNEPPADILKRINNCPYDSSHWERFETVDFCAYRVLPNDMSLNGRAFAISVFLKTFDCRFNCGDILDLKDDTKAVFLGVRYEAEENCNNAAAVLLYFFKFISNAGSTLGETCNKEHIMKSLMLLRLDQLIEFFPDIKTVKGLMYVEPAALEITAVMTQLRAVLFEYKTLAELEEQKTTSPSRPAVPVDPKQPVKVPNSTRPPSIRNKGNKPPTSISSSKKLPEPKLNNKRPYVPPPAATSPPVSSRKRSATELSGCGSNISEFEYTEDSLMLKTKENLFEICRNLQIDIARSSKKDLIISAILHRKTRSKIILPHRERNEVHATGSCVTDVPSLRSVSRAVEQPSNNTMQTHIAANIGKALEGFENRLSNNLTACVSVTKNQSTLLQEELVATKATLAAERQQKKEYKKEATETLNEHVEIFGRISEAATKPLMECMRLYTQTNLAAIEKNNSSNAVTSETPKQPSLIIPSSTPMILHNYHQYQHHAVLPSSAYAPFPSVEQNLMLHPFVSNLQQMGNTHLSTPTTVMPGGGNNISQLLQSIQQQHPGTYPANQMAFLPQQTLQALTPTATPSIGNLLSQLQMGQQGPLQQQDTVVSALQQQLLLRQQQVGGLAPAALHASSSSSSSSSSSFPQQHQQNTSFNQNNHPLSSSCWQQLIQSPPNSNLVNHPTMVQSLQAQCAVPGSSSSSAAFSQAPPQGNNTQQAAMQQLLEALFFNK